MVDSVVELDLDLPDSVCVVAAMLAEPRSDCVCVDRAPPTATKPS